MSAKYAGILVSIYWLTGRFYLFLEIWIPYCIIFYQVNIPVKKLFQCKLEVEIVDKIVFNGSLVKDDRKINVAVPVETISEHRTKDTKLFNLVFLAQSNYISDIPAN